MKANSRLMVITGTVLCGVIVTAVSLTDKQTLAPAATAEYGEYLVRNTAMVLGSGQADPELRYSGTNMACASCHLESGRLPGTLDLLQAAAKYPRFSGRDGGDGDLRDRINGCMTRSMNGHTLPRESTEMRAIETYIIDLGNQYQAMSETARMSSEPPGFKEPARKASLENGQQVFVERCQVCHGANGEGLPASGDIAEGYLFPPLWGADSYNNGAGMTRLLTSASFIKARMPLGSPDLSDDEAYDVAAYMNSHERPVKDNLEADYPELFRKPVDSPYGPYADPFDQEQHKYGPFEPIREFYRNRESGQ